MTQDLFEILRDRRGWTTEHLREINDPTHEPLMDMDAVVEELHRFHTSGDKLVVVPDFDMDGITSGVIGLAGLSELGFNVRLYRPDYAQGHAVTPRDIDSILAQFDDVKGIITCDVGITAHAGIDYAKSKGLRVIVTDHHKETEGRTAADVIVDPARYDETYRLEGICGAHVLYQVLHAYAETHDIARLESIEYLKLFAGVGTVADVMPLIYENRQLVKDSLSIARLLYAKADPEAPLDEIANVENSTLMMLLRAEHHHPLFVSAFEGFATVLAMFTDIGKLRSIKDINASFYGFYLSPTFNAIRRINGDIEMGFGAFFAPTKKEKQACIKVLLDDNQRRKEMVVTYRKAIEERNQPYAPHIYLTDAPTGMLGLLANAIMSDKGYPIVVMRDPTDPDGRAGGSARSLPWYPLNTEVNKAGYTALGHEHACGVQVQSARDLPSLARFLERSIETTWERLVSSGLLAETDRADLVLGDGPDADGSIDEIDEILSLAERIQTLQPFGHGFTEPEIEIVVDLAESHLKVIGSEKTHLAITLHNGIKCLWWNKADLAPDLEEKKESIIPGESTVRLRGKFGVNVFMGTVSANFFIDRLVEPLGEADGV